VCSACREIDEGRFVDLIEVDAASRTKVDDTRELLDNVQYTPTRGRYKVYLIDEVHMLSNHSFNALLKTLEEPPPHVKFLLATTDPQKLPVTVLSRCLQFSLKRLSANLIGERLKFIAAAEKLDYQPAALALLARAAEGSMRDALSLLDQLIAFGGAALTEADARTMLGTIDRGHVAQIVEALSLGDGAALMARVGELDRDAPDYDRALVELAALLQRLAIVQIVPDAASEDEQYDPEILIRLAKALGPEDVQLYYQIALAGRRGLPMAPDPRLGFEMTLLRMLAFRPEAAAPVSAGAAGAALPPGRTAGSGAAVRDHRTAATEPAAVRPPAAASMPAVTSTPAAAASSIDADNWLSVVEAAGLGGMVRQLAFNCVPASYDDAVLVLRLDAAADSRRSKPIEDKLAQGLSKYMGRDVRIVFEVSDGLATPARQRVQADQERTLRAAAAFEQDPAVKGLKERFGAEVDSASVKAADPQF
jgi:DNA polymerase-3 subunit gamma/tau